MTDLEPREPSAVADTEAPEAEPTTPPAESTPRAGESTVAAGESTVLSGESTAQAGESTAQGDESVAAGESTVPPGESTAEAGESSLQAGESTPQPPESAAADAEPDEAVEISDLPPLADDTDLAHALEALLLVVDTPAGEELLADTLDQPVARVTTLLHTMSAEFAERSSGIDLRRAGDGWRFVTRDKYAPYVEKLLLDGQRAKLTRAALETLAVIAYRQPVTRSRVAAVRGVNVDGVIRTLVTRGLIRETGTDSDTGGILYRTTELFLERLGLSSLEDLPAIAPLLPEVDAIDDV
ncbi:MAG TPA: SMC-Scp complex subunit ScpB [Pseudonocardiaceae bacterium]|nr:SMC-Scp complex subunit ScpB [Pseudonocardiaceae bacterium]